MALLPRKSLCKCCVPAWMLGSQPATRVIVASYSQLLREEHSLDMRFVMQSNWCQGAVSAGLPTDPAGAVANSIPTIT